MKIVCYKAIFADPEDESYDTPFPPACPPEADVQYVIFANVPREYTYAGWEVRPQVFTDPNNRRRARHHKTLSHILFPEADFTLWIDGVFTPKVSPTALVNRYMADPVAQIVTHRHPARSCCYTEATAILKRGKDNDRIVHAQMMRYANEKFPRNHGLAETGAMLRRSGMTATFFNELWWKEISNGSQRDQLSFDYCRWKMKLESRYFDGLTKNSPYFSWRSHHG